MDQIDAKQCITGSAWFRRLWGDEFRELICLSIICIRSSTGCILLHWSDVENCSFNPFEST